MPALRVLGGQTGLGVLQGVLSLPKQSAGHRPAYSTIFDKTAALFRSMILNHPFVDGNKRMAVASALAFLYLNDEIVSATDAELVRLALRVASGKSRELSAIATWFERRTLALNEIESAIRRDSMTDLIASLPGRASLPNRPLLDLVVFMIREQL